MLVRIGKGKVTNLTLFAGRRRHSHHDLQIKTLEAYRQRVASADIKTLPLSLANYVCDMAHEISQPCKVYIIQLYVLYS